MKSMTVSDGGHVFTIIVREDVDLPDLPDVEPPHLRFLTWWKGKCGELGIPYQYRTAEPQGHRILKRLFQKHTFEELQELAMVFFLNYGERLQEDPNHFAIFASMLTILEEELKNRV